MAVVLVEPTDPVNIGGVVRVDGQYRVSQPATGAAGRLRALERGRGGPLHAAHRRASAALRVAAARQSQDRHFVVGLTGRHHRVGRNALPFQEAIDRIAEAARGGQDVAVVLRPRRLGHEQRDARRVSRGHDDPDQSRRIRRSTWPRRRCWCCISCSSARAAKTQAFRPPRRSAPPAPSRLLEDLFADLERALDAIEFLKARSRAHTLRSLRVALFRARLDVREASLLRAAALEDSAFSAAQEACFGVRASRRRSAPTRLCAHLDDLRRPARRRRWARRSARRAAWRSRAPGQPWPEADAGS